MHFELRCGGWAVPARSRLAAEDRQRGAAWAVAPAGPMHLFSPLPPQPFQHAVQTAGSCAPAARAVLVRAQAARAMAIVQVASAALTERQRLHLRGGKRWKTETGTASE